MGVFQHININMQCGMTMLVKFQLRAHICQGPWHIGELLLRVRLLDEVVHLGGPGSEVPEMRAVAGVGVGVEDLAASGVGGARVDGGVDVEDVGPGGLPACLRGFLQHPVDEGHVVHLHITNGFLGKRMASKKTIKTSPQGPLSRYPHFDG